MTLFLRSLYTASALSIVYILLLFRSHPHRRMAMPTALVAFVAGILSILPVVVLRRLLPIDPGQAGLGAMLVAVLIEEAAKFLAAAGTIRHFRFPDVIEPIDVAITFGILGVGFGIYEDFWYVFSTSYPSWIAGDAARFSEVFRGISLARAFPGHILFNGLAGFLLGHAWLNERGRRRAMWVAGSVGVAVATHFVFNWVGRSGGMILLLAYVLALGGVYLGLRRWASSHSPFADLQRLVAGEPVVWTHHASPVEILFAEGFDWPGRRRSVVFQFYPIILSLAILFPVLVVGVYFLNRLVLLPFGAP